MPAAETNDDASKIALITGGSRGLGPNTAISLTGKGVDIGPMIASLLSEDNRWVTAQRIEASGGAHL
jgi:NADP-dependent 3-hydroxy acid dehydrogenase YdfG